MSSFASANGPWITGHLAAGKAHARAFRVGCKPSPASITPALMSSSLYFPIATGSPHGAVAGLGVWSALIGVMNFIVSILLSKGLNRWNRGSRSWLRLYLLVERGKPESTRTRKITRHEIAERAEQGVRGRRADATGAEASRSTRACSLRR